MPEYSVRAVHFRSGNAHEITFEANNDLAAMLYAGQVTTKMLDHFPEFLGTPLLVRLTVHNAEHNEIYAGNIKIGTK